MVSHDRCYQASPTFTSVVITESSFLDGNENANHFGLESCSAQEHSLLSISIFVVISACHMLASIFAVSE